MRMKDIALAWVVLELRDSRMRLGFTIGFQLASLGWLIGGASASLIGAELTVLAAGVGFAGISTLIFSLSKEAREAD